MIKQIWTIRSRKKLFVGLSFGIAGFMLFYSFVTLLVLENSIPWRAGFWGTTDRQVSKYMLLILPLFSLACCILLHLYSKRKTIPFRNSRQPSTGYEADEYQNLVIGENFLLCLLLAFAQLDKLNTAKNIAGFSGIIPLLILLTMIVFAALSIRKMCHVPNS